MEAVEYLIKKLPHNSIGLIELTIHSVSWSLLNKLSSDCFTNGSLYREIRVLTITMSRKHCQCRKKNTKENSYSYPLHYCQIAPYFSYLTFWRTTYCVSSTSTMKFSQLSRSTNAPTVIRLAPHLYNASVHIMRLL